MIGNRHRQYSQNQSAVNMEPPHIIVHHEDFTSIIYTEYCEHLKKVEHEALEPVASRISNMENFLKSTSRSRQRMTAASSMGGDDESEEYVYPTLPYFPCSGFGSVLEDTITQMRILVECNNEMRITKTLSDKPHLLALKYGVQQPRKTDELDGIDYKKLGSTEYKLNKLDADRNFVIYIVIQTYFDLCLNKYFKTILDNVDRILDLEDYRQYLEADEEKNRAVYRETMRQLRLQRNNIKRVIYDINVVIDGLKTKVEDASLWTEIQSRYVNNWQSARTEQNTAKIRETETDCTEIIEYYKTRTDHEQRVHSELEMLTNIAINETLQKVEEWMEKYEKDIEVVDIQIQLKRNEYDHMLEKREELEETVAKHEVQMKEWIAFKAQREKDREYAAKMQRSSVIVQAWWRGLLVRRGLGPYKKKKGKA